MRRQMKFILEDPKTKRKFEVDTTCRCGHEYDAHIKDGVVKSCNKCPCTAFNSLKVHREIKSSYPGLASWFAIAAVYFFSIVAAGIWWLLFRSFLRTIGANL